jgi:hypothetical protein
MRSDSGLGEDQTSPPVSSIFERPGFGSVAFRHQGLSVSPTKIPSSLQADRCVEDDSLHSYHHKTAHQTGHRPATGSGSAGSDSIGSAGSLAQRNATLSVHGHHHSTHWADIERDDDPANALDEFDDDHEIAELRGNGCSDGDEDDEVTLVTSALTPPILLLSFLAAHGLTEYMSLFNEEKIDLEALVLLTDDDLKTLGLPLGPRKKLMTAIEKRKSRLREPGLLHDTDL